MFVFTVVALRLLALWLIVTSVASPIFILMGVVGLINLQAEPAYLARAAAFEALPLVLGVLIFLFSRRLAALIVPNSTEPPPPALSERAFTQLSVVVIGLFALVRTIPDIGAVLLADDDITMPPQTVIEAVLGLGLIAGSGMLAGLAGRLRNLSPAERHRG